MLASIIYLFMIPVGLWVNPNGSIIELSCPKPEEYKDRARLPSGCKVEVPGVWLSTDKYRSLEVDLAVAKAELEAKEKLIQDYKAALKASEADLLLCRAAPPCEPCKNFTHQLSGALVGTLITSGACAAWTLSR